MRERVNALFKASEYAACLEALEELDLRLSEGIQPELLSDISAVVQVPLPNPSAHYGANYLVNYWIVS